MVAELIDEASALESTTVGIYRTATVVKGGRRFSWSAMVVVGDHRGSVGIGYGKAPGVPASIEKAQKDSKKRINKVTLKDGTIPHEVIGKFGSSTVKLIPAAPGTGVIAGATVRAVLEMAGVRDCLTKAYGSTNQKNLCKATMEGLKSLRSKEEIAQLRGVDIHTSVVEEILEAGKRYAPTMTESTTKSKPRPAKGKQSAGKSTARSGDSAEKKPEEQKAEAEQAAITNVEIQDKPSDPEPGSDSAGGTSPQATPDTEAGDESSKN